LERAGPGGCCGEHQRWPYLARLVIDPGKPWKNGKEERFNGTVRDECLNMHQFHSLAEACVRLATFRQHYNHERPHSRLGYLTPLAFKTAWYEAQARQQDPNIDT
jgi:putative transposase